MTDPAPEVVERAKPRQVGWWCEEHGMHTDAQHDRGSRCLLRPPGCKPVVIEEETP